MPEPSSDTPTHFGFETIPLSAKQERVDDVFRGVAARYDLMNDLMSAGLHRAWKSALITELGLPRGDRPFKLLDVAGGTGDISFRALKRGGAGVHATLLDINAAMLHEGQRRAEERGFGARLDIVQANAESLPFPDEHFDAVTIAFGIRNVPRIALALAEFRRVLKPGGRFVCLEFSTVDVPLLDRIYDAYSFSVIPRLGGWVANDAQPYQYLVESIRRFPLPEAFAGLMREAGFARVRHSLFTGGIAALHVGWRV